MKPNDDQWDKVSGHEYVHQNVVTGYSTLSWLLDILSTVFFFTCYTINIGTLHCHSLYPSEDLSQPTFNYNPTRIKVGRTVPTHFDRQSKHYLEQSARRGGTSRRRAVEEHPVERWQQRRLVRDVDPVGEERWVAVAGAADA